MLTPITSVRNYVNIEYIAPTGARSPEPDMSNIAVIVGNPFAGSLDHALADAYASAARAAGGDVRVVDLAATEFELSPPMREHLRVDGPDDVDRLGMPVADMIRTIDWADHVVFVYPVWWGTFPAVLKGFIDRVFVSGTAFRYRDHGSRWDRLLAGRTARLIVTMDAPTVFNRIKYRRATEVAMRNPLLWFVGIRTVGVTYFDKVRSSTPRRRATWLERAGRLGARDAGRTGTLRREPAPAGATT